MFASVNITHEAMETFKFAYKYFKKNFPIAIIAEILSLIGIGAEMLMPMLTAILIDHVIQSSAVTSGSGGIFGFLLDGTHGSVHTMELFFSVATMYFILLLLRIVLIYIRDILQEKVGMDLETNLRYAAYDKLMELDSATIAAYNSGELLQTINSDTVMFKELFAHRVPFVMDAIFALTMPIVLLLGINPWLILVPMLMVPFVVKIVLNFKKQARANFKNIRKKSAALNLNTQENIAAVRIVRSFTNEELEMEKFHQSNTEFLEARLKQVWLSSRFHLTINSIKQIAYVSAITIGAILAINGYMTVGSILAASTYVLRIMNNLTNLNNQILTMQQETISGLELKEFMEKESQIPDNKAPNLRSDAPNIELKDVSLVLDGQVILKDINLSIPYGKKLGIVGETGSGKSVLLKTLSRIKDITSGSITIDGYDIKDFGLTNLRNMYSYVFQDVFLFSNTIESNIAFSERDIHEEQVTSAAAHAQASQFISALSDGYQTIIGERGLGISGGQKQRVSIARAFHKNAPVFVLDDSTSALDVNTERILLQDIRENFSEKTVIITAHRFSSVVDCDEILYLRDGEIVERGTFEELMELNGSFARVYNVQQAQQADAINCKSPSKIGGGVNG